MKTNDEIFNKFNGHCAYCGCEITIKSMEIEHIVPKYHFDEGIANVPYKKNDIENLNPACKDCNRYKDTLTVEKFRNLLQTISDRLQKIWIFRIALKYGLIGINQFKVKFYFEKVRENEN